MSRNFDLASLRSQFSTAGPGGKWELGRMDAPTLARLLVGVLLLLNLVAVYFVYAPYGGSAAELEEQVSRLRQQVAQRRTQLERTRLLAGKIEKGRFEGDTFLQQYFLSRPTTYSTVVGEIAQMAKASGVRVREHAFNEEEVEGSADMSMLSITGNYEGTYADLLHFLRQMDQANRLVIIESLAAAPQQSTGVLSIALKFNAFIQERGGLPVAAQPPAGETDRAPNASGQPNAAPVNPAPPVANTVSFPVEVKP